jgi:simple sugar transport system ATP-binding protein
LPVAANLALRTFDQPENTRWRWWLKRKKLRQQAQEKVEQYRIKAASVDQSISQLSGGNKQRCVLARELSAEAKILFIANPCFGLDFQAVNEIRTRIMEARNRGAAVILISEDLDEILELSDRIAVMSQGRIVYETTPMQADINEIGQYMAGHA